MCATEQVIKGLERRLSVYAKDSYKIGIPNYTDKLVKERIIISGL